MTLSPIKADNAQWLVRQAQRDRLPLDPLLAGTGLDPHWVDNKGAVITYAQYRRLVLNLLNGSGDPGIGLKYAKGLNITEFGFLGYAFMSSQNLGEALAIGSRFWELSGQLLKNTIHRDGPHLVLSFYPAASPVGGRVLFYAVEEAFASSMAAIASVIGMPLPIEKMHFSYPAPAHRALYLREFDCPLYFDRGADRIFIGAEFLDLPIITASPEVARVVKKQCEILLPNQGQAQGLAAAVRQILLNSLGAFPNSKAVANALGLSRSTFFRRLKKQNTSFQKILNEIRTEMAMTYLCQTPLSIDQISDRLGFSEPTTFRSAFKKWTGQSASVVRKNSLG